jgi:Predicted membrane protein
MASNYNLLTKIFLKSTGFSYTNMARLFIRLFVGIMFMQFGIRHLVNYSSLASDFPTVLGMTSEVSLILMIVIELVCSLFIMAGFLTRFSVIPPMISMVAAEYYILHDMLPDVSIYGLDSTDPGYLPIMFIGIYLFILLAGPGKISLDYFISLYFIARDGRHEEEELEEV